MPHQIRALRQLRAVHVQSALVFRNIRFNRNAPVTVFRLGFDFRRFRPDANQLFIVAYAQRRAGAKIKHRLGAVGFALPVFAEQHVQPVRKNKGFFAIISEIAESERSDLHNNFARNRKTAAKTLSFPRVLYYNYSRKFQKTQRKNARLHKNYAKKEKNPRKEEIVLAEKSQVLYLWKLIRDRIQNVIPPVVFDTFIKDLEPEDVIGRKIILKAQTVMTADTIVKKHSAAINDAVEKANVGLDGFRMYVENSVAYPLEGEEDFSDSFRTVPLNKNYTFDSFVVYEDSRFAYQAGLSVAQSERALFNPLFLYGKSGVGKTHLLQAIGHEVLHQDSSTNVVYVTGEQFANEFIDASRTQNGQSFTKLRRKYRKADVLLVDDVQFISGKEKTVEEFLHTFDELFHAHKTIVICADAAACDISNLDPRLAARLESGLTVELNLPDDNARLEILRSKRDRAGMNVSDEILEFLASRIQKSVRRLEGALLRVATFTSLSGDMPDIAKIEQLLRDILREETSRILTVDSIQKRVADFYELKVSDLTGKRRPNSIAFPRQIAMYLSRRLTERSLKDIGQAFGGRDHGTVIHANKLVASRMEEDVRVRDIVQRLEEELRD